jgi:arylsulfatase A-like enzyme
MEFLDDPAHRDHLERLYDGEVKYVDAQVERLFAWLRQQGRWDDTLVLVTADHGESLGEHDYWYEHVDPYHVETHVPALFKLPRGEAAGTRVRGPAQTQDLAATVATLLGASFELPGASLAGAIESGSIGQRLLFCQSMFDYSNGHFVASVWNGRFKLLRREAAWENYDSRRIPRLDQLFDVLADPAEKRDLLLESAKPEGLDLEEMRNALDDYVRKCFAVGPAQIDPEVAENLKRLGYGK